jgi:DNA-binding winged helix-turn-helix (wHTH) protein/Tol biopolymer transport system component
LENPSNSQFGPFFLDVRERVLLRDGQPVPVTPKAFDLLAALVEQPGRLISKEELLQKVWPDTFVEEANLAYNVFALRKALGDTADNGQYIETIAKKGYRFTATMTPMTRGNGGSPLPEGVAEAPVREAVGAGTEFLASGKPSPLPATSDVRRYLSSRPLRAAAWLAAGIICASGGVLLMSPRKEVPTSSVIRAQIASGVQLSEASPFALSPDGQQLAFAGTGSDGVTRLWVRRMDAEGARPLAGSEAALGGMTPPMFWSPDSQSVAFNAGGELKRIDVRGGAPRTVCAVPNGAIGGSWNADDVIVVGQAAGGLLRCPAAGGPASEVTRLDATNGESLHLLPSFLPDGRHFLYLSVSRTAPEKSGVYLGSLDEEPGGGRPVRLLPTGFGAAYVGSQGASTGHVVFLQDQTLFAQAFDERLLQLRGDPVSLAHPVGSFLDGGFFAVSQNDVIAFRAPDKEFQLTWLDRRGNRMGTVGDVGLYSAVAISRDDSRVATVKEMFRPNIDQDIWMFDSSQTTMGRVTSEAQLEGSPVWSADGKRLIFTTTGGIGSLFEQVIDRPSSPKPLLKTNEYLIPTSVSADGRFLLYAAATMGKTRLDIWVLSLTAPEKRFPLIQREFDQWQGQFSPDGRWVAYVSNESGRSEVLGRRFAAPSDGRTSEPETVIVSSAGGTAPRWRGDGKELYFVSADGTVMVADVNAGARISVGVPRALFQIPRSHGDWAVVSDGSRFLIAMPAGPDTSAPFTILWNRLTGLRAQPGS